MVYRITNDGSMIMVNEKTWQEFRDSGLFWWMNMILHTFGWAIVMNIDEDGVTVNNVYPARVKFRGFAEENNTDGYKKVSKYMKENANQLEEESNE